MGYLEAPWTLCVSGCKRTWQLRGQCARSTLAARCCAWLRNSGDISGDARDRLWSHELLIHTNVERDSAGVISADCTRLRDIGDCVQVVHDIRDGSGL